MFLLKRQIGIKKHHGKEVKKMKRIVALMITALMVMGMAGPNAIATTDPVAEIISRDQTTVVEIWYDDLGNAIRSKNVTTEKVTRKDADGNVSTTTNVTTVEASFHNGSLKTDSVHSVSETRDSKGNLLSKQEYTDTYVYEEGYLVSVSGSGIYESYQYDEEGNITQHSEATITRTFEVRDGQALLIQSVTEGQTYDKDGSHIKDFRNTSTYTYEYLGGSWVVHQVVTVSETKDTNLAWTDLDETAWETVDGSWERTVRTTTYSRNEQGYITGITQTLEGVRVTITGATDAGAVSRRIEEITNYTYTAELTEYGWTITYECYKWETTGEVKNPNPPTSYDPMLYGTVTTVTINGVTYVAIIVDQIDILDGQGFQEGEGEIWLLTGDLATELMDDIGEKVMVMGDVGQLVENGDEQHYLLQINEDYGGGIVTENVEQRLASYTQETWYQDNLSIMSTIWQGIQYAWREGINFLLLSLL